MNKTDWHLPVQLSHLCRAFVCVPHHLTEEDRPLQERTVFFEVAGPDRHRAQHLVQLLARLWDVDTQHWCERGYIYNIESGLDLLDSRDSLHPNMGLAHRHDLRLFEIGLGDGPGPMGTSYARAADCDLFCTPRVARRLQIALQFIESLYQAPQGAERRAA